MPGNALLRRLGIERPSIIERATEAADSGLWLALRVEAEVTADLLTSLLNHWESAGLASITDVVVPREFTSSPVVRRDGFQWFAEMTGLSNSGSLHPVVPAASKGAERFCRDLHGSVAGLDEATPAGFTDPCFGSRAEREKSFVRCAKALLTGVAQSRIDRLTLWTSSPRVIAGCRGAARNLGLNPGDRYEVCVPESQGVLAASLLREGEIGRMWFAIDQAVIARVMGR